MASESAVSRSHRNHYLRRGRLQSGRRHNASYRGTLLLPRIGIDVDRARTLLLRRGVAVSTVLHGIRTCFSIKVIPASRRLQGGPWLTYWMDHEEFVSGSVALFVGVAAFLADFALPIDIRLTKAFAWPTDIQAIECSDRRRNKTFHGVVGGIDRNRIHTPSG